MTSIAQTRPPGKTPILEPPVDHFRDAIESAAGKLRDGLPITNIELIGLAKLALARIGGGQ